MPRFVSSVAFSDRPMLLAAANGRMLSVNDGTLLDSSVRNRQCFSLRAEHCWRRRDAEPRHPRVRMYVDAMCIYNTPVGYKDPRIHEPHHT